MATRPQSKRKFKSTIPPKRPSSRGGGNTSGFPLGSEVSTVSSYLYLTRPYPYNPDDIIGKKGVRKYTEMARDEQIKAAMLAKQFSVIAPGWEVVPSAHEKQSEKDDAEDVADFVEQNFNDMAGSFDTKLIEMLSALIYGYSVAEKVFWLIDYGDYEGRVGLKELKFRNPEGFDFDMDPYGNLYPDGVLQAQRRLPAEKFVIYSYRKKFSNYYGDSDLRECYRPWWAKDNVIKFMMITLERYGEPTWVFNASGGLSGETKSLLENFMRDIQSKSGLILPDTIQADPKSPATDAGRTYIPVLEYLDGLIRGALGLPSLIGASTSEKEVGSLARSQTQFDLWVTLMEYIRHDVEANLNEQVIKPLVDMNFEVLDGLYPVFRFKALTEDQKTKQFEEYLKGLSGKALTKTREDENFFRERLEMPLLSEDYPVAGEVTPEMQQQQDQMAKEQHDAMIATMNAKAENGGAGLPGGGGFPPKAAKKDNAEAEAVVGDVVRPQQQELKFETEKERHAREYREWKDKQLLQDHLINHERNRDLTGPDARHVSTYMHGTVSMQYLDVPGVDEMHRAMGMEPDLDTEPKKYAQARARLFNKQPKRRVPLSDIRFTQTHVHSGRVEEMSHDPEALNKHVQLLKGGGSHYLMDGHHRVVARHLAGKKFVQAQVFEPKKKFWDEDAHPRHPSGSDRGGEFAPKGEGDRAGEAKGRKEGSGSIADLISRPTPENPNIDANKDGITDAARVGVPGLQTPPPPPDIPRLPNLTHEERAVESNFAEAYEANPSDMVSAYLNQVTTSGAPNTFSTDDAKMLSPDYARSNDNKAVYNVAVHQTANAVAKNAFARYLDEVVSKLPKDQQTILVTAGGVAAGKGYALGNIDSAKSVASKVGAVWDTAGEQNSTELPWVMDEAAKRGMRVVYAYVDADPITTFERVVSRAQKTGRMVDADLYADSYAIGARNFQTFASKNSGKADFLYLSNRTAKPSLLDSFPKDALVDRETVYRAAKKYVSAKADSLSPAVLAGATIGERLWH
jgi:phage gp29-like protein